ncbi:MAG: type II toxin-antitoxin system RelE family toxin [Candidatus Woesearchaeota archaeon]
MFTPDAQKQLDKLESLVQERIASVLDRVRVRPFHHAKKLLGTPYYRFRAGDYRIIASIQNDVMIILVVEVGHRGRVYG